MKQEKELLLKDLCARMPYGVKIHAKYIDTDTNTEVEKVGVLSMIDNDTVVAFTCDDTNCYNYVAIHEVKPYLFPLSSMTKEQESYLHFNTKFTLDICNDLTVKIDEDDNYFYTDTFDYVSLIDWLHKNHFDYRGLIEKGLAIDATGLNIY